MSGQPCSRRTLESRLLGGLARRVAGRYARSAQNEQNRPMWLRLLFVLCYIMIVASRFDGPSPGFVYILTNPSMPGMVKIGFSLGRSSVRAADLSRSTGVPSDFELVYDELVSDCRSVERNLHGRFSGYRVNQKREFFRVPVRRAIAALQEEAQAYKVDPGAEARIDILPALEGRFRRWLREDLVGASIVQVGDLVYLESIFQPSVYSNDLEIQRMDLDFIGEGPGEDEGPSFPASSGVEFNARRFVEMSTYTIYYLTDLFNGDANEYIRQLHCDQEDIPFHA